MRSEAFPTVCSNQTSEDDLSERESVSLWVLLACCISYRSTIRIDCVQRARFSERSKSWSWINFHLADFSSFVFYSRSEARSEVWKEQTPHKLYSRERRQILLFRFSTRKSGVGGFECKSRNCFYWSTQIVLNKHFILKMRPNLLLPLFCLGRAWVQLCS